MIDIVLFYTRCLGLFHIWVQPECDADGNADIGMRCDCRYRRVCVRCGAETRNDE